MAWGVLMRTPVWKEIYKGPLMFNGGTTGQTQTLHGAPWVLALRVQQVRIPWAWTLQAPHLALWTIPWPWRQGPEVSQRARQSGSAQDRCGSTSWTTGQAQTSHDTQWACMEKQEPWMLILARLASANNSRHAMSSGIWCSSEWKFLAHGHCQIHVYRIGPHRDVSQRTRQLGMEKGPLMLRLLNSWASPNFSFQGKFPGRQQSRSGSSLVELKVHIKFVELNSCTWKLFDTTKHEVSKVIAFHLWHPVGGPHGASGTPLVFFCCWTNVMGWQLNFSGIRPKVGAPTGPNPQQKTLQHIPSSCQSQQMSKNIPHGKHNNFHFTIEVGIASLDSDAFGDVATCSPSILELQARARAPNTPPKTCSFATICDPQEAPTHLGTPDKQPHKPRQSTMTPTQTTMPWESTMSTITQYSRTPFSENWSTPHASYQANIARHQLMSAQNNCAFSFGTENHCRWQFNHQVRGGLGRQLHLVQSLTCHKEHDSFQSRSPRGFALVPGP